MAARVCPGNRASTMLMPELRAYRLGQLLALYQDFQLGVSYKQPL